MVEANNLFYMEYNNFILNQLELQIKQTIMEYNLPVGTVCLLLKDIAHEVEYLYEQQIQREQAAYLEEHKDDMQQNNDVTSTMQEVQTPMQGRVIIDNIKPEEVELHYTNPELADKKIDAKLDEFKIKQVDIGQE